MNNINPFAELAVKMIGQQAILKLSELGDPNLDILDKQLEIRDTISKSLKIANSAPKGQISIYLLDRVPRGAYDAKKLMINSKFGCSFMNTEDLECHLNHTIIFIKPTWRDDFIVFTGSINLYIDQLTEDK